MATRGGGARPTGTDGTDFTHREKVASRYETSAQTKTYIRFAIYMHFMLSVVIVLQVISHYFKQYLPLFLTEIFPQPQYWQYIWLVSVLCSAIGYLSLNRNILSYLNVYYYGTLGFGLAPVLFTILFNATDLWQYVQTRETKNLFNGFPIIVLSYIFLFVAIQIHLFGIYFARILLRTWKGSKKQK